jgi:hypothetical protein
MSIAPKTSTNKSNPLMNTTNINWEKHFGLPKDDIPSELPQGFLECIPIDYQIKSIEEIKERFESNIEQVGSSHYVANIDCKSNLGKRKNDVGNANCEDKENMKISFNFFISTSIVQ